MSTPAIPHSVRDLLWLLLAGFFTSGGIAGLLSYLRFRRKDSADVNESQARTRSLDTQSSISAGDMVLRYIDRLSNTQVTIDDLRRELADWREQAKERAEETDMLRAANSLLESQLQECEIQRRYWEAEARKWR